MTDIKEGKNRITELLERVEGNPRYSWIHPIVQHLLAPSNSSPENNSSIIDHGIMNLETYGQLMNSMAPRLEGFAIDQNEQAKIGDKSPYGIPLLPIQDIKVVTQNIYERWLLNGKCFNENDLIHLSTEFGKALAVNGRAVLRRAIYHKEERFTPSLQTYNNKSTVGEILDSIQDLYEKYADQYPEDTYIHEAFFYPYVDPELPPNPREANILPIGGVISPIHSLENSNGRLSFEILVGYGDSAIHNTGHPEADRIIVHVDKPDEKNPVGTPYRGERLTAPFKTVMIVQRGNLPEEWNAKPLTTTEGKNSDFYEVPIGERVLDVTLPDNLAEALAIHLANCMWDTNTTRKMEFSMGKIKGKDGKDLGYLPIILENVPYTPPERKLGLQEYGIGQLTATLNETKDLDVLIELLTKTDKHSRPIVVCTPQFLDLARDNVNLRHRVAGISTQLLILSPLQPTEHVARDWKDTHTLIPISNINAEEFLKESSTYQMGSKYRVRTVDGIGTLSPINDDEMEAILPPILTIRQSWLMGFDTAREIGGKAKGLATLDRLHYPISDNSLTLTTTFFEQVVKHNNLSELINELDKAETPRKLKQLFRRIQHNLNEIPESMLDELMSKMSASKDQSSQDPLFAFRSNLNLEDDGKHPMAGVYGSELTVRLKKDDIANALLKVIRQYFNPETAQKIFDDLSGKDRRQKLKEVLGSVLVQPRFESQFSGTLFSYESSAATANQKKELTLQISRGVGGVVDGSSAITIKRDRESETFSITNEAGKPILSSTEFKKLSANDTTLGLPKHVIVNLLKLLKYAAKVMNDEQDMEWAARFNENTSKWEIVFLQTRPILTA